jgi:hypothetical protein
MKRPEQTRNRAPRNRALRGWKVTRLPAAPALGCKANRANRAPRNDSNCAVRNSLWITARIPALARKAPNRATAQLSPLKGRWPLSGGPTTFLWTNP